jgi:hypothetical protein
MNVGRVSPKISKQHISAEQRRESERAKRPCGF